MAQLYARRGIVTAQRLPRPTPRAGNEPLGVGESFTWVVLGGTGAYEHLNGSGQGETIPNADPSTGNTNIYSGFLVG